MMKEDRQLSVHIAGNTAAGKSSLAALIMKTLREHGVETTVECQDGDIGYRLAMTTEELVANIKAVPHIVDNNAREIRA